MIYTQVIGNHGIHAVIHHPVMYHVSTYSGSGDYSTEGWGFFFCSPLLWIAFGLILNIVSFFTAVDKDDQRVAGAVVIHSIIAIAASIAVTAIGVSIVHDIAPEMSKSDLLLVQQIFYLMTGLIALSYLRVIRYLHQPPMQVLVPIGANALICQQIAQQYYRAGYYNLEFVPDASVTLNYSTGYYY